MQHSANEDGGADEKGDKTRITLPFSCSRVGKVDSEKENLPCQVVEEVGPNNDECVSNGCEMSGSLVESDLLTQVASLPSAATDEDGDNDSLQNEGSLLSSPVKTSQQQTQQNFSLMERRALNEQRNKDLLENLGLAFGIGGTFSNNKKKAPLASTGDDTSDCDDDSDEDEYLPNGQMKRRGMLLNIHHDLVPPPGPTDDVISTAAVAARKNDLIYELQTNKTLYPYRESQIRKLLSLCSMATDQPLLAPGDTENHGQTSATYVPAPIFVTGPSGTGKTAIINDVVRAIKKRYDGRENVGPEQAPNRMAAVSAYVNCATIDTPSMNELTRNAYMQFVEDVEQRSITRMRGAKRRRGRKRKAEQQVAKGGMESRTDDILAANDSTNDDHGTCIDEDLEERIERKRANGRRSRKAKDGTERNDKSISSETNTPTGWAPQIAAWTFGRDLAALFGKRYCGLLVLDHAERLMLLSQRKGGSENCNFLSQLLLLPRTLGLNLSLIVVTNNVLLEHSRLNNNASAQRSLSTIASGIQPIHIHFDAYKRRNMVKTILRTEKLKRLIVGEDVKVFEHAGFEKVFESFADTLEKAVIDSTTNLQEIVRFARFIWPKYIAPLQAKVIDGTLEAARKSLGQSVSDGSSISSAILAHLDREIMPQLRHSLKQGLFMLDYDSHEEIKTQSRETHELPSLTRYLLLAAYICQANRPDRDKQLFSIQGNGRKRRSRRQSDAGEELAFGSAAQNQQQPKTLRPRAFPLERMLSVYVSMIGLNKLPDKQDCPEEMLRSLGTTSFSETLSHLRDIGLLHEQPLRSLSDPIRLVEPRYYCSLTRGEANAIAKTTGFPLEKYIL